MEPVNKSELLSLGAYEEIRDRFRARVVQEKKRRRIAVGDNMTAIFENRDTVLFQVQEMLRTERITSDSGIAHELQTYNSLIPEQHGLSITLFVEYTDKDERDRMLVELAGMESQVFMAVDDVRVEGVPQDRGERTDRTTAVHYFKFALGPDLAKAIASGGATVALGVDHPAYQAVTTLGAASLEALRDDLA